MMSDADGTDPPGLLERARRLEAKLGRPLRVAHIGNVAANGYLNAKFLRAVGIEADCIAYDYDHVMGTPEWEELDIRHPHGDDYHPVFDGRDVAGYRRPEWFLSGSLEECADRASRRHGTPGTGSARQGTRPRRGSAAGGWLGDALRMSLADPVRFLLQVENRLAGGAPVLTRLLGTLGLRDGASAARLVRLFAKRFPDRPDKLSLFDVMINQTKGRLFRKIAANYDIVQCYGLEPVYACVGECRPLVAFEHGTLRDYALADNYLSRLNALAYGTADHCFVTNGDALEVVRRLGISGYSAIPHPIDVDKHRRRDEAAIARIRAEADATGDLIFCPLRHDHRAKGTDVVVRALPLIKARFPSAKFVLVDWGLETGSSRRMLADSGCAQDVLWVPPMSRARMIHFIQSSTIVLDQMALPHFGSTAPQALAAGTPVVSSYGPDSTAWMFQEPAPILSAHDEAEIVEAVALARDPAWRADFERRARDWIDTWHGTERVVGEHLRVYGRILGVEDGHRPLP